MKVSEINDGLEKLQGWEILSAGPGKNITLRLVNTQLTRNATGQWFARLYPVKGGDQSIFSTVERGFHNTAEEALAKLAAMVNQAADGVNQALKGMTE